MKSSNNQLMFGKVNSILNDKFDIFLERFFKATSLTKKLSIWMQNEKFCEPFK